MVHAMRKRKVFHSVFVIIIIFIVYTFLWNKIWSRVDRNRNGQEDDPLSEVEISVSEAIDNSKRGEQERNIAQNRRIPSTFSAVDNQVAFYSTEGNFLQNQKDLEKKSLGNSRGWDGSETRLGALNEDHQTHLSSTTSEGLGNKKFSYFKTTDVQNGSVTVRSELPFPSIEFHSEHLSSSTVMLPRNSSVVRSRLKKPERIDPGHPPVTEEHMVNDRLQKTIEENERDDTLLLAGETAKKNFKVAKLPDENALIENVPKRDTSKGDFLHSQVHRNKKKKRMSSGGMSQPADDDLAEFAGMLTQPLYNLPLLSHKNSSENVTGIKSGDIRLTSSEKPPLSEDLDFRLSLHTESSEIAVKGKINTTKQYAVFSTTSTGRASLNFIFLLPLTAFAWRRVGFDSIVLIIGSHDDWKNDVLLNFVLEQLAKVDAVVVFVAARAERSIMMSQVSRIFVANMLSKIFPGIDNVYIITSDADLWPIDRNSFLLPKGSRILSLNSDCCGQFKHRGKPYKMLPISNIGMTVKTWNEVTHKFDTSPSSPDDILTFVYRMFGVNALKGVEKGENIGWYLDQMSISILIAEWAELYNATGIRYVFRDTGIDRLDRNSWQLGNRKLGGIIDTHLLDNAYVPGIWVQITRLLREMYGDMTEPYLWCVEYYEHFQEVFIQEKSRLRSQFS